MPYALSAVAAVVYIVATCALATDRRRLALAAVGIELVGVLAVGVTQPRLTRSSPTRASGRTSVSATGGCRWSCPSWASGGSCAGRDRPMTEVRRPRARPGWLRCERRRARNPRTSWRPSSPSRSADSRSARPSSSRWGCCPRSPAASVSPSRGRATSSRRTPRASSSAPRSSSPSPPGCRGAACRRPRAVPRAGQRGHRPRARLLAGDGRPVPRRTAARRLLRGGVADRRVPVAPERRGRAVSR